MSTNHFTHPTSLGVSGVKGLAAIYRSIAQGSRNVLQLSLDRGRRELHRGLIGIAEDFVHFCVVLVLLFVTMAVLYHTVCDLASSKEPIAQAAISAVNGGLFAIIIVEVVRTVMVHFGHDGLQPEPFLRVAIISAVREILSVGAHLSLQGGDHAGGPAMVHLALLELGVNGAVVVGLAASFLLIRRRAGMPGMSTNRLA